jgi:hypothetical protein
MAAGDLITLPYQFEFNNLLFGDQSSYDISGIDGLDLMAVREGDVKKPLDHGSFDLTPDLMSTRTVIMRANIITSDPNAIVNLRTATSLFESYEPQLIPLVFQLLDGVKKRVNCRVRRRALPIDRDFALGYGNFTLMFWCPDPRIYENVLNTATAGLAVEGTGFAFDMLFDLSFGGSVGGGTLATCNNIGDITTPPVVTLTGPLTAPQLQNQTTGETWKSTIALGSGEVLTVDFAARTVMLGTATRYSTLTADSIWWMLRPGVNVVRLSASSGSGTANIAWRSAWHAAV